MQKHAHLSSVPPEAGSLSVWSLPCSPLPVQAQPCLQTPRGLLSPWGGSGFRFPPFPLQPPEDSEKPNVGSVSLGPRVSWPPPPSSSSIGLNPLTWLSLSSLFCFPLPVTRAPAVTLSPPGGSGCPPVSAAAGQQPQPHPPSFRFGVGPRGTRDSGVNARGYFSCPPRFGRVVSPHAA